jgi:hypothetical protein
MLRFGEAGAAQAVDEIAASENGARRSGREAVVDLYIRGPNRAALEPRRVVVELSADE